MSAIAELSRQELYERVWSRPATKVAAELGISDVGLLKVCTRHEIPKPPKGHWTKVAIGKPVDQPPLAPASNPDLDRVSFSANAGGPASVKAEPPPMVPVPKRLTSPNPFVLAALTQLEGRDHSSDGLLWAGGRTAVRIAVTRGNVGRAVRIMDTVIKELLALGFELGPQGSYDHADVVFKRAGWTYPIKLREHLKRTSLPLTPKQQEEIRKWGHCFGDRFKHTPDGKLILTFGEDFSPTLCQDTVNTKLEDKLGRFVERVRNRIAEEDQRARQRAQEAAERERVLAEQRRRDEEVARLKKEEQDRVNALNDEIARWRLSRDVRDYLGEMRELISSHGATVTEGGSLAKWLLWAEEFAQRIDPFTPLRKDLEKLKETHIASGEHPQPNGPPGTDSDRASSIKR